MADVVVIGAGLMGAATAWRLAQAGHAVTVLERSTPANRHGSSHGSARIVRYAYPDRRYVELMVEARTGWNELEAARDATLITPTGALDHGERHDPEGFAALLDAAGVPHELLTAAEASARWELPIRTSALWHPDAGVLDAERAVTAMLAEATRHGAVVETGWELARVERTAGGYRVVGRDARAVDAAQVVVAAGGWLPALLGDLSLPTAFVSALPALEVRQEQAFHFPFRDAGRAWPTLIHKSDDIVLYALPGGRDAGGRGLKVAEFNGGRRLASAAEQDGVVDAANRARIAAYVQANLPGLIPQPYAETTCLFTNTPTEDFVIDRVEGVTVLSPCSGHGAKFAPLVGEFARRLVEGSDSVPRAFRPSLS